jgi:hypothetical protein
LFLRQLLHQEYEDGINALHKELEKCRCKSKTGTLACTLPLMTPSCRQVIFDITKLRENTKQFTPKLQEGKKFVKVTPGTASNASECAELEDSIWYDNKSTQQTKKYNELRIDGCIYLSKILDLIQAGQTVSQRTVEGTAECTRLQISRTVYYLFHNLWDNDPFPDASCHAKSLRERDNLKSSGKCF